MNNHKESESQWPCCDQSAGLVKFNNPGRSQDITQEALHCGELSAVPRNQTSVDAATKQPYQLQAASICLDAGPGTVQSATISRGPDRAHMQTTCHACGMHGLTCSQYCYFFYINLYTSHLVYARPSSILSSIRCWTRVLCCNPCAF